MEGLVDIFYQWDVFMAGVFVGLVIMYFRIRYLRTKTDWKFPNERR